ncbi:hypothetical protein SAMN05216570_0467 [Dyella sp. OK004]|uniref:hypothetical protein n=1 Tax=Dyella sp. OK004 TaxID=1855292 RepID=UPI0008E10F3A|nr:hypothetical protein [Dyella sp. OK004]SFR90206.1 hypothetical protein SAMN05216570_0467 [Dyella sp. OK004]
MPSKRSTPSAALALALTLATSTYGSPMNTPDIKQNPHPQMRYEVTMTIEGAPGPFETVTGFMQYEVLDDRCLPMQDPISGAKKHPMTDPPIHFERVSDNVYKGVVYADLLQNEDYYGLGICKWSLVSAIGRLQGKEATFSPDLSLDELVAQERKTLYFYKGNYSHNSVKDSVFAGVPLSDHIKAHRDDFFSVTLEAREVFP